jgi:hypothetical protein
MQGGTAPAAVLSDSPDGGIEDVAAKKIAGGGAADEGAGVRAGDDLEQQVRR